MENWFDPRAMGSSPDLYSPIGGLGDVIVAARERRRKQAMAEREMALKERQGTSQMALENRRADLYGKQIDAQNKSIDRQDRVANQKFQIEEAKRRGEVGRDIGRAFGQGRPGQAAVIAHSSQFVGPDDQLQGVDLQPVPNPVERKPQPAVPQAPEWQGPLEPPDEARARAMFEGLGRMGQGQQGTEPPPFDPNAPTPEDQGAAAMKAGDEAANFSTQQQGARDKFAMQQRDFPGQKIEADKSEAAFADAEKNPKYKVSYPGGTSDVIDPREEKKAITAEAVDRADKLEQAAAAIASTRPDVAESMIQQSRLIRSGISNADKAPITNMGAAVQSQGAKAVESEKDREVKRMAIRAKAMHKGLKGGSDLPSPEEARVLREMDNALTETTRKGGLEEQVQHMGQTLNQLKAQPDNPVLWTNAIDAAIRTNTGRAAIKAQYDLYRQHAGGSAAKFEDWLQGVSDGNLGGTSKANFMGAFDAGYNELRGATKGEYDKIRRYDSDPRVKNHKAVNLGYQARVRNAFGADPGFAGNEQKPTQAPAPAAGGATTTVKMPDGTMATFDAAGKRIK